MALSHIGRIPSAGFLCGLNWKVNEEIMLSEKRSKIFVKYRSYLHNKQGDRSSGNVASFQELDLLSLFLLSSSVPRTLSTPLQKVRGIAMRTLRTNQDLGVGNGILTLPTSARTKEVGRETW